MSTLHDRLVDLAEHPLGPISDGATGAEVWELGVRIRRERRIAVTAVAAIAAALLVALGVVTWARLPHVDPRPADAPAGIPDRLYAPSPRLSGTEDGGPIGPLAAVFPAHRGGGGDTVNALVGVSATSGAYRFLDLPDHSFGTGADLSPDGRHLAYWVEGRATHADAVDAALTVYDTVTGQRRTYPIPSDYGLQQEQVHWLGDQTLVVEYALSTRTSVHTDGGFEGQQPQPTLVWDLTRPRPERAPQAWTGAVAASADALVTSTSRLQAVDAQTLRIIARFPEVEGFVGTPALDPTGTRLAILLGKTAPGQSGFRGLGPVTVMTAAGGRLVPGSTQADEIIGWSDARHVLVEAQIGSGHRTTALVSLDVDTGELRKLTTYDADFPAQGVEFASDLAGAGVVPAVRPPSPFAPWPIVGWLTAILCGTGLSVAGILRSSGRRRVRR